MKEVRKVCTLYCIVRRS